MSHLQPISRLPLRLSGPSRSLSKRYYAAGRRQITITNDDGRVNWSDLSTREKAARSTQQTFNFAIILVGATLTIGVGYVMFSDVFSAESKTSYFNRAVNRIKASGECEKALGPSNKMVFYGDSPWSSFRRARVTEPTPITQRMKNERTGVESIKMQFKVVGTKAEGWATMHLEKQSDEIEYHYVLLSVDVPGHQRIYLEGKPSILGKRGPSTIFGVKWSS